MTIYIETTTLYVISSGDVISTSRTITIPPIVIETISQPTFIPVSVSIPTSVAIVPRSEVSHCNAPKVVTAAFVTAIYSFSPA
jgi:hypothetical protein